MDMEGDIYHLYGRQTGQGVTGQARLPLFSLAKHYGREGKFPLQASGISQMTYQATVGTPATHPDTPRSRLLAPQKQNHTLHMLDTFSGYSLEVVGGARGWIWITRCHLIHF